MDYPLPLYKPKALNISFYMHACLCDLLPNGGSLTTVDVHGWCVSTRLYGNFTEIVHGWRCLQTRAHTHTHTHTHTHSHTHNDETSLIGTISHKYQVSNKWAIKLKFMWMITIYNQNQPFKPLKTLAVRMQCVYLIMYIICKLKHYSFSFESIELCETSYFQHDLYIIWLYIFSWFISPSIIDGLLKLFYDEATQRSARDPY